MHFLLAAAAALQLVSAAVDLRSIKQASTAVTLPNTYIVELKTGNYLKRGFASPHAELYHDLRRHGIAWKVRNSYSDPLFTGTAVTLSSADDLPKLAQAAGVESIHPVFIHPGPKPFSKQVLASTVDTSAVRGILSTHAMTGVDKLHAEGYRGKGITIGIIDTGVDYTHPALGGKFGSGNKIVGGHDFVGDNYTGIDTPVPDNNPIDLCNGHGTHVAGIIGANPNNPYNISGVAYEANINAYRVFGCSGGVTDDVLVDALLRAYNDGNDIITMSLGYSQAWAQSSFAPSVVASRIISKGRIFTSAAGNDGDLGSWFTSGPASTPGIISVGSIDNTVGLFYNASVSNGRLIPYISFQDPRPLSIPAGLPLYATSSDITVTDDACNPLPPSTPDLSNRLVIIRRGTCSMYIKLDNAATFGAQYFLIYDNLDQKLGILQISEYNVSLISQQDGVFLVQQAIPQNLTLSFPDLSYNAPLPGGGLVSSFSTYGPTNDMYLKPAVSAPGGSILSTYPLSLGAYAILSGTSMSTPFVAGASALLLQVRGKTRETARAARSIFENTAVPVKQTASNTSLLEAASHQGAGLIQVFDAVKNTGSMLPAELLLNDTAHFNGVHRLLIKNGGKQSVTYSLSHVPAGTANTLNGIANNVGPVPLVPNAAEVTITPSTLTIPAGQALPVAVTFKPPTGLNPANFSVYSGYIKATGTDNTTLQSIYLGVAANLKEMKIIDHTDTLLGFKLPALVDYYGNPVPDSGSATFSMNDTDVPFLFYRLVGGTRLYRLDLIDAQTNDTHRSVEIEQQSHPTSPFPTLGLLYKAEYATRDQGSNPGDLSGVQVFPAYRFANGSAIPNGRYKILMQALKITGNLKERADYDTWASPVAVIKRA